MNLQQENNIPKNEKEAQLKVLSNYYNHCCKKLSNNKFIDACEKNQIKKQQRY